jgi:hypothetical protein
MHTELNHKKLEKKNQKNPQPIVFNFFYQIFGSIVAVDLVVKDCSKNKL